MSNSGKTRESPEHGIGHRSMVEEDQKQPKFDLILSNLSHIFGYDIDSKYTALIEVINLVINCGQNSIAYKILYN
ncbi:MAG: hypothetical protein MHMPM18_002437 [Marteilia pararefringens]